MKPERVCEVSLSSDLPTLSLLTPIPKKLLQDLSSTFPLLFSFPSSPKTHHYFPPREACRASIQDYMEILPRQERAPMI
jgi:hypothetical protein